MRMHAVNVVLVVALAAFVGSSLAAQRTFVSAKSGDDAAPCSLAAPCRSFAAAINQTDDGGEIIVIDSGGYGPVEIHKSVAIRSPQGIYAGISAFADSLGGLGVGVFVQFPGPGPGRAILDGITITGLGAQRGIVFNGNGELRLSRVDIQGMTLEGIRVNPDNQSLVVADSIVARNGGHGILLASTGFFSSAVIEHCRIEDNGGSAVAVQDNGVVHLRDSSLYRNLRGVDVSTTASAPASMDIDGTTIVENGVGLFSSMGGTGLARIRIARSSIVGNTSLGIDAQGGSSILSRGDNTVVDNAGGETFTGSYAPK
jgi:hypothetical protein